MKVGFTGTRQGMTILQLQTLERHLANLAIEEWHDGDCKGADEQANQLVWAMDSNIAEMHGHPCNIANWRAHNEYDIIYPVKPPLVRNRDIVRSVDVMFGAPDGYDEVFRGSGTWATIRYAKRAEVPITVIFPDGSEEEFRVA